jgi:hypothetical protein
LSAQALPSAPAPLLLTAGAPCPLQELMREHTYGEGAVHLAIIDTRKVRDWLPGYLRRIGEVGLVMVQVETRQNWWRYDETEPLYRYGWIYFSLTQPGGRKLALGMGRRLAKATRGNPALLDRSEVMAVLWVSVENRFPVLQREWDDSLTLLGGTW